MVNAVVHTQGRQLGLVRFSVQLGELLPGDSAVYVLVELLERGRRIEGFLCFGVILLHMPAHMS